jgi:L-seryl-tRNA(Ser) seleniumtransferase
VVGGGTYPGVELPSWTLRVRIPGFSAGELAARLRDREVPVVTRVEGEEVVLDLRTVLPQQDPELVGALLEVLDGDG